MNNATSYSWRRLSPAAWRLLLGTIFVAVAAAVVYDGLLRQRYLRHSEVANKPGVYRLPDGLKLHIEVDGDGIVQYRLKDDSGRVLLRSSESPSTYHRWYFVYDHRSWLWFWSSDVGGKLWKPGKGRYYRDYPLPDLSSAPSTFKEALPESARRRLGN